MWEGGREGGKKRGGDDYLCAEEIECKFHVPDGVWLNVDKH